MKAQIELDQIQAVLSAMEQIPAVPRIEQWGLVYVCYNTLKSMHADAKKELEARKEEEQ